MLQNFNTKFVFNENNLVFVIECSIRGVTALVNRDFAFLLINVPKIQNLVLVPVLI